MKQEITSKDTSIRQISAVYTNYEFPKHSRILDIGCGKWYQDTIEYMANKGCVCAGYDPYNQIREINELSLSLFEDICPDYIVCSNVLNVLSDEEYIFDVLQMVDKYTDSDTEIIFSIYQGDKSGIGKRTTKGWQRNMKTKDYEKLVSNVFDVVKVKGNFIECRKLKKAA